jgi:hypothetical protein
MGSFVECYLHEGLKLSDFHHLSERTEKLNLIKNIFNNKDVAIAYAEKVFTIEDFKDVLENQISILTTSEALEIYKATDIRPKDFKDLPESLIYHLISQKALEIYKSTEISPQDIKDVLEHQKRQQTIKKNYEFLKIKLAKP